MVDFLNFLGDFWPLLLMLFVVAAGFILATVLVVVVIIGVVTLIVRPKHAMAWLLVEVHRPLRAARRAASVTGDLHVHGPMTIWTAVPHPLVEQLPAIYEAVAGIYSELTATPLAKLPAVRVLCFADQVSFDGYSRRWKMTGTAGYSTVYRSSIICLAPAVPALASQHNLPAWLIAEHLLNHERAWWLSIGLCRLIAARVANQPTDWNRRRRVLEFGRQTGMLLSPEALVGFGRQRQPQWHASAATYQLFVIHTQFALLTDWLVDNRPEVIAACVRGDFQRARKPAALFAKLVGRTPEEAWHAAWATLPQPAPPPVMPPPEFVRIINDHLLPLIRDRDADSSMRRSAMVELTTSGYAHGAHALIDLLADPADAALHEEAHWALQLMAGRVMGREPEAWRQWLAETVAC